MLEVELEGASSEMRLWWLVIEGGDVNLCQKDPGHEVDVYISGALDLMVQVWLGRTDLRDAMRRGAVEVTGRRDLLESLPV